MDVLKDTRVDCFSLVKIYKISDYLELVKPAYEQKGNIEGQREALKTKSAITIRNRMREDIIKGTILPPIVIGLVINEQSFKKIDQFIKQKRYDQIEKIIASAEAENISIIDGMQRTTSIMEAMSENKNISDNSVRVEFWITKNVNSLLYRMLILNTGQVPWNLKRQIEVVYNPLIKEFETNVESLNLSTVDNSAYRTRAGDYQAEKIIELFLVFGTREVKVNTKDALADEFTKLDFIEVISENQLNRLFVKYLHYMIEFDKIVFPITSELTGIEDGKFKNGRDLFSSQTLRAGFVAAIAKYIFGLPGEDYSIEQQNHNSDRLSNLFNSYFENLVSKSPSELADYLDLMTLNELMGTVNKGIGDFERRFFTKAFETLIDKNFEFQTLTPCWRAGSR